MRTGLWWHMPLIPALRRQKQMDLCEFKASLDRLQKYRESKSQTNKNKGKKPTYIGFLASIFFSESKPFIHLFNFIKESKTDPQRCAPIELCMSLNMILMSYLVSGHYPPGSLRVS